jgi:hypothetical protein
MSKHGKHDRIKEYINYSNQLFSRPYKYMKETLKTNEKELGKELE